MPNYLKEAFKELELLNEETFSFDKDGAAELKKFYDGDTTDDYESIIDPEAETKDELEDSYEGKVIIACKICHGMQYKDPQDIVIDEESDYVNVGEECPACSAVDGYKIVGQVAPYCAECDEEGEDVEETNVVEESLNKKRKTMLVIESLKNAPKKHFEESLNEEKLTTLFDVVGGMLDGTMDRITINKKTGKKQAVGTKTPYDASEDIGVDDDGYFVWVADEAGAKYAQEVADKFGLKTKLDAPTKYISASKNRKFHIYIPESRFDEPVEQVVEESLSEGIVDESGSNPRAVWVDAVRNELGKPAYTDSYPKRSIYRLKYVFDLEDKYEAEAFAEKARKLDHVKRVIGPKETSMWRGGPDVFMVNVMVDYPPIEQAVEESCGKLEESHDKAYIMSQILLKLEDEGYDVRSHKKDAIAYAESAADLIMIAPDGYTVDKWFEDTKMNYPEDLLRFKKFSDLKESVENITVETDSDTIKVEPSEDGKVEVKTEPKQKDEKNDEEMIVPVSAETKDEIDVNDANFDETDVDIDIDSIDDEGFDVLGESYLKKVYENVKSFKTSSSSIKDGKLMVEGIISFNSGKKAKTSFVFESISKTKRGKIKFLGENLNFSKSKSAFTLTAKPEGKKAVCESLTYNYVAKDSKSNKKLPVYGKVSK